MISGNAQSYASRRPRERGVASYCRNKVFPLVIGVLPPLKYRFSHIFVTGRTHLGMIHRYWKLLASAAIVSGEPGSKTCVKNCFRFAEFKGSVNPGYERQKKAAPKGRRSEARLKCLEHNLAGELDDSSRRQAGEERSVRTGRRRRRDQRLTKGPIGEIVIWVSKIGVIEDVVEVG